MEFSRQEYWSGLPFRSPERLGQTCFWVFGCLLWSYRSAVACHRGRGSGCSWPAYDISPLGGGRHYPTIKPPELTQDQGNRLLAQTKPCAHQDTGERSSDPSRDWPRFAHECPGVSCRGVDWWWPAAGSRALSEAVCQGLFEGGRYYLHYLHHSLASGQTTGREYSPTHQQKIGLKIYEHGPAQHKKTQFPPQSVSAIRKLP